MRPSRHAVTAGLVTLGLVAGACSSSKSSTTTATTAAGRSATTAAGGGPTATTAAKCSLTSPIKIVGLAEKPPEGPNAIPDFAEGWDLAVDDIGGTVCGQKFDFQRLPANPTDSAIAKNQFLQAVDMKPNAIVGIVSSTPAIAIAPEVAKDNIPVVYMTISNSLLVGTPNSVGSPWGFVLRPRNASIAALEVDYAVKELGKKNLGLLCISMPFGQQGCDAAAQEAAAVGATIVDRENNDLADKDLTSKIVALKNKNPDAVITFTFPNNLVTFYNQAADNGLNVPIFGSSSAGLVAAAVKPAARPNMYGTDDCVPVGDPTQKDWVAKYEKKFNKKMAGSGYGVAEAYDSLMLVKAIIEKNNSADPAKIADGLRSVTYKGVCTTYKADPGQDLNHVTTVDQFDANGVAIPKKSYDITV